MPQWTFEQECENSLAILRDGQKIAEIVNDDATTATERHNARLICDACNLYEQRQTKEVSSG